MLAKAIARYVPVSLGDEVAAFARTVVADAEPKSVARAKALLYAAGRLGAFGTSVGLELDPSVMLHPSVIERFIIVRTAEMSPAMRRTLRSNLRALAATPWPTGPGSGLPLARAGQGSLFFGRDRCLPGPGRRPADAGPTQAPLGAHRLGGRGGADGGRPARRARHRCHRPLGRPGDRGQRTPGPGRSGSHPLSRASARQCVFRRSGLM